MKYRRKPEPDIEAFQYLAGMGVNDLPEWAKLEVEHHNLFVAPYELSCSIYVGDPVYDAVWAADGDYVTNGEDGVLSVMGKNHFESLYEPIIQK